MRHPERALHWACAPTGWHARAPAAAPATRLSYLFGIHAALQVLLPVPERANQWVRKPNAAPFLGGASAIDRMLGGQVADLFVVRQYLDAQRGGKS